jgi:hypothetical protein
MIGDLYDAKNVVVGQAAVLIAPAGTACPLITSAVLSDPFSLAPWAAASFEAAATITAGAAILITYEFEGTTYTTAAMAFGALTAADIAAALLLALAPLDITADQITVTGGPLSTALTPVYITLDEAFAGGTWGFTPGAGFTGGPVTVTQPIWTPVGATDQGWTWAAAKTLQDITIEEQSTLVDRLVSSQTFTVTGALSEDISRTLALVYNMDLAITAPTVSDPGYETLTLTDTPIEYAVALIMANNFGYPRWLYIPQTTCLDNVSTPLRRAAAKRMYSAQFTSVCQTSDIQVFNIVAPPT